MTEFLAFDSGNRLLQAVHADLQVPAFLVGCRALGLTGKFITAPLWCYMVEDGIPFQEVVNVCQALAVSLGQYAEDAALLVNATATAFPGTKIVRQSKVYDKLLAPSDNDQLLKELLQLLRTCFHTYMHNATVLGGRLQHASNCRRNC